MSDTLNLSGFDSMPMGLVGIANQKFFDCMLEMGAERIEPSESSKPYLKFKEMIVYKSEYTPHLLVFVDGKLDRTFYFKDGPKP